MIYRLEVAFDHFQVLIGDSVRGPVADTTDLWESGTGSIAQLASGEVIAVGTVRYGGKVNVTVEVAGSPRALPEDWATLGEFVLDVPSGRLILWGPEAGNLDQVPSIPLEPALYSGRAYSKGEDSVKDEMEAEGADEYRIVIWKNE